MYKKNMPQRFHIIGSVGSGKTTLAKKISTQLGIPFYELDNVVWIRHEAGDIRRTEEERTEYLHSIVQTDAWIIEGVHNEEWVAESFEHADVIIFLDPDYSVRTYRIIKRFFRQKIGLEKSHYHPTFSIFFKMFKWNRFFEEYGKPRFFEKYHLHNHKIKVIKDGKKLNNVIG